MAFADVTLSPVYTAAMGLVSEERGLSLRFPRFLKVREDKSVEEASESEFLAALWRKQEARGVSAGEVTRNENEDDDNDDWVKPGAFVCHITTHDHDGSPQRSLD